jgi:hypothetical protein
MKTFSYKLEGPCNERVEVSVEAKNLDGAEAELLKLGYNLSYQGGWLIRGLVIIPVEKVIHE